ncbi:tyrosine-type recombinase/integrase [Nonomuraea rubra]|uniref:tyrosine-type recombinase/integrase n=1 Tax=Nonomuraea rubra TaxID=46180 RepID=UPI0033CF1D86
MATQLTVVNGQVEEGDPKTEASNDLVALGTATLDVLRIHHARQLTEGLHWGPAWQDSGRIFTKEDGSPPHPDVVSKRFERLSFAAGLPPIRLHDLRHGAATLSLAAGNDIKITSAMLRHSSLAMTSDLYTAVLPEMAHAAAEASAALVPRTASLRDLPATGGLPPSPQPEPSQPPHPKHEVSAMAGTWSAAISRGIGGSAIWPRGRSTRCQSARRGFVTLQSQADCGMWRSSPPGGPMGGPTERGTVTGSSASRPGSCPARNPCAAIPLGPILHPAQPGRGRGPHLSSRTPVHGVSPSSRRWAGPRIPLSDPRVLVAAVSAAAGRGTSTHVEPVLS